MKQTILEVQYYKGEGLAPRKYTYKTDLDIPIGLDIYVPVRKTHSKAKVVNVIPFGEAGYDEAIQAMESLGFGMDKVREFTGNDLVVTLVKRQSL